MIIIRQRITHFAGRVRKRFRSRALEWEHSIVMTLWGSVVIANPAVMDGPSFEAFLGGPFIWGPALLGSGLLRIAALCINGYVARPTALVRAVGAVIGIALFAAISLGLLFSWRWGTGLSVYPVLGFFGLFSLNWSIFDVAIPDTHDDDDH